MRAAILIILALTAVQEALPQTASSTFSVEAWSDTAGPYGVIWHLEIRRDGSAIVFIGGPNKPNEERRFTLSPKHRAAIIRAIEDAKFFDLPEYLGPMMVPLHEPENVLHVDLTARARKVRLHDPSKARGAAQGRFKEVWKVLAAASPIKPPL